MLIDRLAKLPNEIAKAAKEARLLSDQLLILKDSLAMIDAENAAAIVADGELKNDQARRAKKLELERDPDYVDLLTQIREMSRLIDLRTIEHQRLRDEFSATKLMAQLDISRFDLAAA